MTPATSRSNPPIPPVTESDFSEALWVLAARVGKVVDALPNTSFGRYVAEQLLRCGSASPRNYDDSVAADSREEFVGKLAASLKELRETRAWLRLISKTELLPTARLADFVNEVDPLFRALEQTVIAAKESGTAGPAPRRAASAVPWSGSRPPMNPGVAHQGLDHIAIAVADTDEALKIWRDRLGFPVLYSEVVNAGAIRLTHLDLGNAHLQLVQPLAAGHPLHAWIAQHGGAGLHHFCLRVDDVGAAHAALLPKGLALAAPHQGTQGKRALFLEKSATHGVQVEVTGR